MDTVLFFLHIRGLKPLLVVYFRVEEKFAGGKFREIPFGVDLIFAGGKFRAKSKFANIAKISSTRKIGVIQYLRIKLGEQMFIRESRSKQLCSPQARPTSDCVYAVRYLH